MRHRRARTDGRNHRAARPWASSKGRRLRWRKVQRTKAASRRPGQGQKGILRFEGYAGEEVELSHRRLPGVAPRPAEPRGSRTALRGTAQSKKMVPRRDRPPRGFPHQHLKLARLPISPPRLSAGAPAGRRNVQTPRGDVNRDQAYSPRHLSWPRPLHRDRGGFQNDSPEAEIHHLLVRQERRLKAPSGVFTKHEVLAI